MVRRSAPILLLLLALASPAWGVIAFVQETDAGWFGGSGTTESVSLTGVGANALAVAFLCWGTATSTLTSLKDGTNTFLVIDTLTGSTSGVCKTLYFNNGASGSVTYTATWGADPGFGTLYIHEVSGQHTTAPLDQFTKNEQSPAPTGVNAVTSGNVTPTVDGEYIFGGVFDRSGSGNTWSAGTNVAFTGRSSTAASFRYSEEFVQTTAALLAADFTQVNSAGTNSLTMIATFKPVAAAVGPPLRTLMGVGL